MMKTFLAAATLTAAALMCLPAQAQSGGPGMPTATPKAGATSSTSGQATTGGAVTTGAGQTGAQTGAQINTQSNTSGSISGGGVQANTGANINAGANAGMRNQAQAPMRGARGEAAEMRMTECLNNAMAQRQPIGSCQR